MHSCDNVGVCFKIFKANCLGEFQSHGALGRLLLGNVSVLEFTVPWLLCNGGI